MEHKLGIVLFLPFSPPLDSAVGSFDPGTGGFEIDRICAKISSIACPPPDQIMPRLERLTLTPSATAIAAANRQKRAPWFGGVNVVLACLGLYRASSLWFVLPPLAIFGASVVNRKLEGNRFARSYAEVDRKWIRALHTWRTKIGAADVQQLRTSLDTTAELYKALLSDERRQINDYKNERRTRQLRAFLEGFEIRHSRIRGIGPAKQAALDSFGIESAADVTLERLMAVPGFGPTNSQGLIDWREKLEQRFVFREQATDIDKREVARIRAGFAAKASMLRTNLLAGSTKLVNLAANLSAARDMDDPELATIYREREQAKCDIQYLGIPLPSSDTISS